MYNKTPYTGLNFYKLKQQAQELTKEFDENRLHKIIIL